jgi:4-amino-4-deoxy-L-arabinose transferase-like glycosyltransferase
VKKSSIIPVLFFAVVFSFAISNWGLTETSEARYAQISQEMYVSQDYLHPTLLGIYHFHKPPLTYYITSLGYALFGINERGARFFLMIALLLQLVLVYRITKDFSKNEEAAVAAMLLYFSYPIVLAATKNLTTDAYLTTFIFGAIWSFIRYKQQDKTIYFYLFCFLCGLAFLTKGPVGIMPQLLFAIAYSKQYPANKAAGLHWYLALLIGVLVSFSWFILLIINKPELLNYFIKHQLVDRVASNAFSRSQPWWYYLATIPLLGFPAFLYFADYLRLVVRYRARVIQASPPLLFSLAVSLLVFSLSASKLVLYVLPLYLFIAMISALHLVKMSERSRQIIQTTSVCYACILFSILIAICFLRIPYHIPLLPTLPLALTGLLCSLFIYFKTFASPALKGPLLHAWVMLVLIITLPFIMAQNEDKINSIKPLASFIQQHKSNAAQTNVAVYNLLLPSLSFYTHNNIITIDNGNRQAKRETQFTNDTDKNTNGYIKMEGTESINRIRVLLNEPGSFLVARKKNDLPDSLSLLINHMHHKAILNQWIIYY